MLLNWFPVQNQNHDSSISGRYLLKASRLKSRNQINARSTILNDSQSNGKSWESLWSCSKVRLDWKYQFFDHSVFSLTSWFEYSNVKISIDIALLQDCYRLFNPWIMQCVFQTFLLRSARLWSSNDTPYHTAFPAILLYKAAW